MDFKPGDTLPTGETFLCYTEDGSPIWYEPVPTVASTRMVTIPICPDLLRYDQLGEADNLRGRAVRAFFWIMRAWRI